jgi:hypothetical protein
LRSPLDSMSRNNNHVSASEEMPVSLASKVPSPDVKLFNTAGRQIKLGQAPKTR